MSVEKQIQDMLARGFVTLSYRNKKARELQAEFLAGEVRDQLEHIEPYGFTSEPKADTQPEAFAMFFDGNRTNGIVFCVADRRYRLTNMQPGEVALYDDQGQKIVLSRSGVIVETPKNLTAKVGGSTTLTSGGNVDITAPMTHIHGPLTVDGAINAASVTASGEVSGSGVNLSTHTHNHGPTPD